MNDNESVGRVARAIIAKAASDPWLQENHARVGAYLEQHPDVAQRAARMVEADPSAGLDYMLTVARNDIGDAPQYQTRAPQTADPWAGAVGTNDRLLPMGGPIPHDAPVPTRFDGLPRGGYPRETPDRRPVFQGNLPDGAGQKYQGPPPNADNGTVDIGVLPSFQPAAPPSVGYQGETGHPIWGAPDEKTQAWLDFQRTGSKQAAQRYGHARLRGVVTDDFLNQ